MVQRFGSNVAAEVRGVNEKIGSITGSFKALAGLTIAGFGVQQFTGMIEGAIDAQAHLKDLGEKAGTTAEKMSSLIPAARLSGTSLDEVAAASGKFSKNLVEIQTGEGKAAEAFKRLGFNAADAARFLKDPVQGMFELSKAANKYADDGNKVAVMQAVLGKGAAGVANFMKELGQQTELVTRVTNEQAEAADRLQDQFALIKLGGEEMRMSFANALIPTLSQMALQFLAAKDAGAGFWQALAIATVSGDKVVERITDLGTTVTETKKQIELASEPTATDMFGAISADEHLKALNSTLEETNKKLKIYQQIRDQTIFQKLEKVDTSDVRDLRYGTNANVIRTPTSLNAKGLGDDKNKLDEFTKALQSMRQEAAAANGALDALENGTDKLTAAQQGLAKLQASEVWKTFSKSQQDALIALTATTSATQKHIDVMTRFKGVVDKLTEGDQWNNWTADFKALTDAFNDPKGKLSLDEYRALTQKLLDLQPYWKAQVQLVKDQADALAKMEEATSQAAAANRKLADDFKRDQEQQANDIEFQITLIGKTAAEQELLTAARQVDLEVKRQIQALDALDPESDKMREKIILQGELSKARIDGALRVKQATETGVANMQTVFNTLDSTARSIFDSIGQKGTNMWQKIKDDGKRILLDFLYSLTVKPFLIQIAASLTGVSGGAAANILGGGAAQNPLAALTGGGGGISNVMSLFGAAGSTFGTTASAAALEAFGGMGASQAAILAAQTAEFGIAGTAATLSATGTTMGAAAGTMATAMGVVGTAIPILGLAIAAYMYWDSTKKPSEVRGQFQIGGTDFEDQISTATKFGAIGFADVGTQQFSGEAAQVFNKIVAGALDAFETRFSDEQSARLADILQNTTFASQEGTFTTEDFLQQYGGGVLQQVIVAAFDVLDPALAAVARGFEGTADEVAKFGNTLLGVYDATQLIGNADFTAGIDTALAGATQESADKILAFVNVAATFGTTVAGLGDALQALDPTKITEFVDALGGAQAFAQRFASFNQNFGTAPDVAAAATTRLNTAFAKLGVEVPKTHAEFVALVNQMIAVGDTDAVDTLLGVSDAFVTLHGTAEQLRQALLAAAAAGRQYYAEHFLTPDERLLGRQTVDSTVIYTATRGTTALGAALHVLGVEELPLTVAGIRDVRASLVAMYGEGSEVVNQFDAILPSIGDLIDSVGGFGDAAEDAATQVNKATDVIVVSVGGLIKQSQSLADTLIGQIADLAGESTGDFGTKLGIQIGLIRDAVANASRADFTSNTAFTAYVGRLKSTAAQLTSELSRFTILSAQYDAARAEQLISLQDWYAQQFHIFGGDTAFNKNTAALDALKIIFDQKWKSIVDGVKDGVDGAIDQLAKLREGIADYLRGLSLSDLSPLSPLERLNQSQAAFAGELVKAQAGDLGALGDITQFAGDFLKQARDFYASAPAYTDIYTAVTEALAALAGSTPTGLPLPGADAQASAAVALESALPAGTIASQTDIQENTQAVRDNGAILAALYQEHAATNTMTGEQNATLQRILAAASRTPVPAR